MFNKPKNNFHSGFPRKVDIWNENFNHSAKPGKRQQRHRQKIPRKLFFLLNKFKLNRIKNGKDKKSMKQQQWLKLLFNFRNKRLFNVSFFRFIFWKEVVCKFLRRLLLSLLLQLLLFVLLLRCHCCCCCRRYCCRCCCRCYCCCCAVGWSDRCSVRWSPSLVHFTLFFVFLLEKKFASSNLSRVYFVAHFPWVHFLSFWPYVEL